MVTNTTITSAKTTQVFCGVQVEDAPPNAGRPGDLLRRRSTLVGASVGRLRLPGFIPF